MPRPTIAESVAEASRGRMIHIWQMKDPQNPDDWVSLPMLMQQNADKFFAQYQLNIHEARVRLEKGQIKQSKFDSVVNSCRYPLILMHRSGEPATAKYIKEHLIRGEGGQMRLKVGNLKVTDVVFVYIITLYNQYIYMCVYNKYNYI